MQNIKHKLAVSLLLVFMVASVGFKDIGVLVNDITVPAGEKSTASFKNEEVVEVLKENNDSYVVGKEGQVFAIPRSSMIRTTRSTDKYVVKNATPLLDLPTNSAKVREVAKVDDLYSIRMLEGDFGLFAALEGESLGYARLSDFERVVERNISYGYATKSVTLKNNEDILVLMEGESVGVVDFKDNKYTLVNENSVEFKVEKEAIELYDTLESVTRGVERDKSAKITKLVQTAHDLLGSRYAYATAGPRTFDCSGFTYYLYRSQLGMTIPRSSTPQASVGVFVEKNDLKPGDLVFFNTTGRRISHVGLYIGDGNMIHASSGRMQVRIDTINSGYYLQRYITARRVIK